MGIKYEATGPDSIPSFIFKAAADQLAPILTELYQTSLNTGAVPQDWKDAHVVPLFVEVQELYIGVHQRVLELAWRQSLQV
jgi:hypothetical protein